MHGLIFAGLKNWVETTWGNPTWAKMLAKVELPKRLYDYREVYPDSEAIGLVTAASSLLRRTAPGLLEDFGEYIAPKLLSLYRPLLDPEWGSLELLLQVEKTIHVVVRQRKPGAAPPRIRCERLDDKSVLINYDSARKLCALLRGIVKGVGKSYGDELEISEQACMHQGAESCQLRISLKAGVQETVAGTEATIDPRAIAPTKRYTKPVKMAGRAFGRYRVTGEIGRGAMGLVLEARDPMLERDVALKLLLESATLNVELHGRFLREARTAARMSHPNIISVFDIGEDQGQPFYVMERVRGRDLKEWAGLSPSFSELLSLMRSLAGALDYAHKKGVIHRDLKPANIMVRDDGRAVIMDFGVARDTHEDVRLTRIGEIIGTPQYMAPEQFEGLPELVGAHTDVYAMGVVLFELLNGTPPFSGTSLAMIVRQVLIDEAPALPPDPSRPPGLEAVLRRCLAKGLEQRYTNAAELAHALEAVEIAL